MEVQISSGLPQGQGLCMQQTGYGISPLGGGLELADLQDLLELTSKKKKCPFHYRGLESKSRKSRDNWSNRQIWPWGTG